MPKRKIPAKDELPIITEERCKGCGACCLHMTCPPFIVQRHFKDYNGKSYTTDDTDHLLSITADDEIFAKIPDEIKRSLRAEKIKILKEGYFEEPCFWLDKETLMCKHHEHRPTVCREFEPGGDNCLNFRDLHEIDFLDEVVEFAESLEEKHRQNRKRTKTE